MDNNQNFEKTPENVSGKKPSDVGAGPVEWVNDGGQEGEAKQPKEHTGKLTNMGGATGGTPGLPDVSEGNDNTSRD